MGNLAPRSPSFVVLPFLFSLHFVQKPYVYIVMVNSSRADTLSTQLQGQQGHSSISVEV